MTTQSIDQFDALSNSVGVVKERKAIVRKTIGKKTRMGFVEFVHHLLVWNETKRETDAKLKAMILDEFGHSTKTVQSFQDGCSSISKLQNEFNRGYYQSFLKDGKVPVLSLKYDESKNPVETTRPTFRLSNGKVLEYLEKFPLVAESYTDVMTRLVRNPEKWADADSVE